MSTTPTPIVNGPNLDGMDSEDLMSFWSKHQRGQGYRAFFPNGGKGTINATGDLAAYACNKATAMSCRAAGNIKSALCYEDICDKIYAAMPAWARSW